MNKPRIFVATVDQPKDWVEEDDRFPQYIRLSSVIGMSLQHSHIFILGPKSQEQQSQLHQQPSIKQVRVDSLQELAGLVCDAIDDKELTLLGHIHLTPLSRKRLAIIRKRLDADPADLLQTLLSNKNVDVYVDGEKLFQFLNPRFRDVPSDSWPNLFIKLRDAFEKVEVEEVAEDETKNLKSNASTPVKVKPRGHLNHDPQMQQRANEIAADNMKVPGISITRNRVAKLLANELGMEMDTVLRRIRKQW